MIFRGKYRQFLFQLHKRRTPRGVFFLESFPRFHAKNNDEGTCDKFEFMNSDLIEVRSNFFCCKLVSDSLDDPFLLTEWTTLKLGLNFD